MTEKTKKAEKISFEAALAELEDIVAQLENGEAALEDAITLYERGEELRKTCEKQLQAAKMKIETLAKEKQKQE